MRAARRAAIAGSWKLDIPIEEILSYTGTMEIVHENNADWYIKLTSSGVLTLAKDIQADIFLVGAGGGGKVRNANDGGYGGSGGGYIVLEKDIPLAAGDYPVTVGNAASPVTVGNEASSGFGFTAAAGALPSSFGSSSAGGAGGTVGGAGGEIWGGNGKAGKNGQFAFKDSAYASLGYFGSSGGGGGGGGARNTQRNTPGAGGAGGRGGRRWRGRWRIRHQSRRRAACYKLRLRRRRRGWTRNRIGNW